MGLIVSPECPACAGDLADLGPAPGTAGLVDRRRARCEPCKINLVVTVTVRTPPPGWGTLGRPQGNPQPVDGR